jgi:hypothetical protein
MHLVKATSLAKLRGLDEDTARGLAMLGWDEMRLHFEDEDLPSDVLALWLCRANVLGASDLNRMPSRRERAALEADPHYAARCNFPMWYFEALLIANGFVTYSSSYGLIVNLAPIGSA